MRFLVYILTVFIVFSCARQGTPSGGPKDEMPPKFLGSLPDTLSVNVPVDLKEIRIDFDEYIILKDPTQQIIVSPPLGSNAVFMPVGSPRRYIQIKLEEPLLENTTYNINFGNSIQDNNEGNKLPYFQYVFSTGDHVDSLRIQGKLSVLSEKKLSENSLVALFKVDSGYRDSLILKEKPFYVARPDSEGNFTLNYLKPGKYQLVAFDDKVQNMRYDSGQEKLGFVDSYINLNENTSADLQLFDQLQGYKAGKAEQKGYGHLVFRFTGQPEEVEITPIDFDFTTSRISYLPKSDSLNFWFKPDVDSVSGSSKRLNFLVKHKNYEDTVSLVYSNSIRHQLSVKEDNKGFYTPSQKLKFSANYPIEKIDPGFISVKKDTLELTFQTLLDSIHENTFAIDFPIELTTAYEVNLLSGAVTDFFGETNDTIRVKFRTKSRNDFGNLRLTLQNKPDRPFWIQLLNAKDEIIDEQYSTENSFEYTYLNPGEYYFKILVDENANGHWDTGDFFQRKQPERAMVYPTMLQVRAMWDLDETWVLSESKPVENKESPTANSGDSN